MKEFAVSEEVHYYIPAMFPINKISAYIAEEVKGICDKQDALLEYDDHSRRRVPNGLLYDISNLEFIRGKYRYDKMIAIVPESYFVFHKGPEHGSVGFIIRPARQVRWFWLFGIREFLAEYRGSWNVAFVKDNQLNKGTVAHELAHTLGEGKEHYYPKSGKVENCRRFNGSVYKQCHIYTVDQALDTWIDKKGRQVYRFIKKKFSIMNNNNDKERKDVKDLWILRDTFQKTFLALKKYGAVIKPHVNLYQESSRYKSLKAVVSGFYYQKEKAFLAPQLKVYKTAFKTASLPMPKNKKTQFITFQLKEKDQILKQSRQAVIDMECEIFYKNKSSKTLPFKFSPFLVSFKLPKDIQERSLRVNVLSPTGRLIYTAPIRIKKKKKDLVSLINKVQ